MFNGWHRLSPQNLAAALLLKPYRSSCTIHPLLRYRTRQNKFNGPSDLRSKPFDGANIAIGSQINPAPSVGRNGRCCCRNLSPKWANATGHHNSPFVFGLSVRIVGLLSLERPQSFGQIRDKFSLLASVKHCDNAGLGSADRYALTVRCIVQLQ